jgi:hypothetical protein
LHKVYLDTCIPLKPFYPILAETEAIGNTLDDEWHGVRVSKAKSLLQLIGQRALKWSTSDYFFREFAGLTQYNPENRARIEHDPALYELLRWIYKLARRADQIGETPEINEEADDLVYLSATHDPVFRLEAMDARHLISSFKAYAYRFLTYDHSSILNRHKAFIDMEGCLYNPNFRCEDPVESGFPECQTLNFRQ